MTTYPHMPFRVNLIVVTWIVLTALVIMHITDRRAGGE